jgi:glycolate oxidase iron-sulfur subunit
MRAVVDGRLDPGSDAFQTHMDRCLGCRACEPVCPSGVEYGSLLEAARDVAARHRAPALITRLLVRIFGSVSLRWAFFLGGRLVRGTGVAALGARLLPARGLAGSARLGMAMLAATAPWKGLRTAGSGAGAAGDEAGPRGKGRVAVLLGCVQEGLFGRVNDATVRVLEANGFEVVSVRGQDCCGALHAHAGDLEGARALARINVARFEAAGVDWVVVNAAGCGAAMKQYGDLLGADAAFAGRAAALAKNVKDVSEILAESGPRRGAPVPCRVAYDHPCHLLHAQRIEQAPLKVLAAVPGAEVRVVDDASECCGGAGIYGITHPDLGGRIGGDKIAAVRRAGCDVAATPNPGCMMQIGAGLRLEGAPEGVIHPVELLDESYRRAGYYA